ncbi:hypothetical protein TrVFT333_000053 [Trichoderma virens FT-333]|nr:hypothetical protein TrVFT333_000053 [Trichoderma virens FT-333]
MRLLSTENLQFFEFYGNDAPQYAILSHRWESDEISYQDMHDTKKHENKQGFRKISQFRQLALRDGYKYVWVDTCCIDKSSSAELQEAINSMYQWYRKSGGCYAYLSDVPAPNHNVDWRGKSSYGATFLESFKASLWFTRGWTLQELIAPENVVFVDANWKKFGTARDLKKSINEVTGIGVQNFIGETNLQTLRVGRVMSWAAKRQTTRVEDRAYSLLGLTEIDLPMLYGQGERAFQRLQEEILKVNDDASILVWGCIDTDTDFTSNGLATSPANFQKYPILVRPMKQIHSFVNLPSTLTPQGLQTTLRIRRDPIDDAIRYAVLVDHKGQRFRHRISLIIPLMFPRTAPSRFTPENECVRFSDPVWVSSNFVEKAVPELVCFIRKVKALDINFKRDGFSLSSRVWKSYSTTFTYPVQTQSGNRHFPAILGGLSRKGKVNRRGYTFILELTALKQESARFVVLVDYQLHNQRLVDTPTVTVINIRRQLYLANAVRLAERRTARSAYVPCDLLDNHGRAIPMKDIVRVHEFNSYWIHAEDNDFDKPPPRLVGEILTMELNTITAKRYDKNGTAK